MDSSTYPRSTPATPATRAEPRAAREVGGNRLADYIVDVFFIVLLAAPFLIFESPASVQEAVVATRAADTNVAAAVASAPAVPARDDGAYGPQ